MGYDFHITRAVDWSDSERNPISAEEWLAFIESDSGLSFFKENGEVFAVWKTTLLGLIGVTAKFIQKSRQTNRLENASNCR